MHSDEQKQLDFPSIGLKITGACILNCGFCCEPNRDQETYSKDRFFEIISILHKNYGVRRICFTGGDPLMHQDVVSILQFARTLGIYVLLLTSNGKLLYSLYQKLENSINAVRISVHGIGEDHDEIVGQVGAFNDIERSIKLIDKERIPVMVTTVVTNKTIDQVISIAEWGYNLGVSHYYLFGLMKSGKGQDYINNHGQPSNESVQNIKRKISSRYDGKMQITFYEYLNKAECILVYGDGRIVIDPCPNGTNFQKEIGNIFLDQPEIIFNNFNNDPGNIVGYGIHHPNI